jgi:hypothetical protein
MPAPFIAERTNDSTVARIERATSGLRGIPTLPICAAQNEIRPADPQLRTDSDTSARRETRAIAEIRPRGNDTAA